MRTLVILLLGALLGLGCASTKSNSEIMAERQSRARPSIHTYSSEGFYGMQPSAPERPVQNQEFFFKKCTLQSRSPNPTQAEWACSGP